MIICKPWIISSSLICLERKNLSQPEKNSNFLIPKSLQPCAVNLWYFKVRWFDSIKFIIWKTLGLLQWVAKKLGFKNPSLSIELNSFVKSIKNGGFNKILCRPFYLPTKSCKLCTLNLHLKHSNFFFKYFLWTGSIGLNKYFLNMVKIMKCSIHSGTFKIFSRSSSRISYLGTKIDFSGFKIEKWRNLPHCLWDKDIRRVNWNDVPFSCLTLNIYLLFYSVSAARNDSCKTIFWVDF